MNKGVIEKWDNEQTEMVKHLWKKYTAEKIAEVMNKIYGTKRTRNAILGKLWRVK